MAYSRARHLCTILLASGRVKRAASNWGDGSVATDDYLAIIDLASNTMSALTISVEEGPEEIIANGGTVYVAHQGGFSQNNVISVVNTSTDVVLATIAVGDVPNSMQLDSSGNLWVLSGGKPSWTGDETGGRLTKIDTNANNSLTSIEFLATEHPNHLALDNGALYYYMSGSVFKMASSETTLPTTAEITGLSFYGMTVNDSILYGVDAAIPSTKLIGNTYSSDYKYLTSALANNGKIGPIFSFFFGLKGISPENGARTSVYLASSDEIEGITGGYYEKFQAVRSAPASYDEDAAARLWEISVDMTNILTH